MVGEEALENALVDVVTGMQDYPFGVPLFSSAR
jgi:hypothetical protein